MTNLLTKGAIDDLGDIIRSEADGLSDETLTSLQQYRTSHRDALAQVFNILCSKARLVHYSAIVTYRIKRFESIIGKLIRYPEMRFNRMWDIAGCRCILRDDDDVYKLRASLQSEKSIEIIKEYDYIKNPQKDGYKSLHLFIKYVDTDKVVEVQIRNQENHNWATLVEITDLLYDTKVKELGNNVDFGRLHYLLSDIKGLDIDQKLEIAYLLKKYNYLERLNNVFARNSIQVRKQWFDIEVKNNHRFFCIETSRDSVPQITSFKSFTEAEDFYFGVYKSMQNANILLTHLPTANYSQISIAYSNYILTFHAFQYEFYELLESLLKDSISKHKYFSFSRTYRLYMALLFHHIANLMDEIREVHKIGLVKGLKTKTKRQEWANHLRKQLDDMKKRSEKLKVSLKPCLPQNFIMQLPFILMGHFISRPFNHRINAHIEKLKSSVN